MKLLCSVLDRVMICSKYTPLLGDNPVSTYLLGI